MKVALNGSNSSGMKAPVIDQNANGMKVAVNAHGMKVAAIDSNVGGMKVDERHTLP